MVESIVLIIACYAIEEGDGLLQSAHGLGSFICYAFLPDYLIELWDDAED